VTQASGTLWNQWRHEKKMWSGRHCGGDEGSKVEMETY
jgi:hypothetical protein